MSDQDAPPPPDGAPAGAAPAAGFESLAALRLAHQDLLERQAGSDTAPPQTIPPAEIAACLDKVKATGTILDDPEDRRIAQRILDYWAADLVAASRTAPVEVGPVQLAPYAPPARPVGSAGEAADDAAPSGGAFQRPEDARQYIRTAALARQWRDCDARGDSSARGYLLTGDALRDAERFARDPDVAALIAASRAAEGETNRRRQRFKNRLIAAMAVVILLLSVLSGVSYWQWRRAQEGWAAEAEAARQALAARDAAEVARTAAEEAKAAVERLKLQQAKEESAQARAAEARARLEAQAATAALEESRRLADRLRDTIAANTARLAAERGLQQTLDAAAEILAAQIAAGSLDYDSVDDPALRELLRPWLATDISIAGLQSYAPPTAGAEPPGEQAASDAAPDASAEPVTPPDQIATVIPPGRDEKPGEPLDGSGFDGYDPGFLGIDLPLPSLTEQQAAAAWQRGAPIPYHNFSIILDVQRRLALLSATNLDRVASRTLPQAPDPIPRPDPRIPEEAQPDDAIFAGVDTLRGHLVERDDISWGELPPSPVAAAEFVAQVTSLYPNLVPQHAAVHQGSWRAVEEWVRLYHNPGAPRVTILAGPVFARDVAAPVAYWKIAVSAQARLAKGVTQTQLVVDAFLVPNDAAPPPSSRGWEAERFRTTLDQIVVRTGLRFPSAMVDATRSGEKLAARLADLDGQTAEQRKQLVQEVLTLLRSPTAAAVDQRTVAAALLDMAGNEAVAAMSPQGRVNLFFLLSEIPAATWDRAAWLPLKGEARWAVADLRVDLGPEARGYLQALRASLGLADAPGQTVYLQFAGLTREDARALSERLRTLGWQVPGEERRPERVNQVRYNPSNPADVQAARLLAADLDAAGFPGVEPTAFDIVKPGIIEVWVSR